MNKYHITQKAVEDLDSIWEYTLKNWSEKQADIYYHQLTQTFSEIAAKPVQHDRLYAEIQQGLYCRRSGKHLIFYKLNDNHEVVIIRILHEKMDIPQKFQ